MDIKASGRSALIIAAGLSMCLWGALQPSPSVAAPASQTASGDAGANTKAKKTAKQRAAPASKQAATAATAAKPIVQAPADAKVESTEPKPLADGSSALPPSVANANAQLPPGEATNAVAPTVAAAAAATAATPNPHPAVTEPGVVAADEVNDLDRAAAETPQAEPHAGDPSPAKLAMAQAPAQAEVAVAAQNDGAWDKASLIGKIFIAAGGLLTLASAARMFMA